MAMLGHRLKSAAVLLLAALVLMPAAVAFAVEPDEVLQDAALEARARRLSAELRCVVCQNQSIDDSNAPLAKDLRLIVRERLQAGDSDDAVLDFIVARYGTFVLLRPPLEPGTLLLWGTPLIVLGGIGTVLALHLRRRRVEVASRTPAADTLSPQEQARLDDILRERM
jgi:cytochrome c-type biogenesis protein CcmH